MVGGVPTNNENQGELIPWAPRDNANLCENCTRVLVLTKFVEVKVPNFVKMGSRWARFLPRIYGFLWVVNFRSPLVSISVAGVSNLTEIRLKLVTMRVLSNY